LPTACCNDISLIAGIYAQIERDLISVAEPPEPHIPLPDWAG
jgi:hypothetical protein